MWIRVFYIGMLAGVPTLFYRDMKQVRRENVISALDWFHQRQKLVKRKDTLDLGQDRE